MMNIQPGDRVLMRKPHPCGSLEWIVQRVGADVILRCVGCDRSVMLARRVFVKRVKKIMSQRNDGNLGGI